MRSVHVAGLPAGAGNLRRGPGGGLYNPDKRTEPWKHAVAARAAAAMGGAGVTREPIGLSLRFTFTRPAGQLRKDGGLRSSARLWPTVRPDVDKLARAVLDALTGVVYHDDAQVVALEVLKSYGPSAGLVLAWHPAGEPELNLALREGVSLLDVI